MQDFAVERDSVCQSNFDAFWSRNINVYHLVVKHHIFSIDIQEGLVADKYLCYMHY